MDFLIDDWLHRSVRSRTQDCQSCNMGSNPIGAANVDSSSIGRASDCGSDGCEFDSRLSTQKFKQRCIMGIMKKQLIEELIEDENSQIDFVEISSEESARVELEADMARQRERDRIQMEMYDDPYLNWSGHR